MRIQQRPVPVYNEADWPSSIPPVIQRIYAARGSVRPESVEHSLSKMLHWKDLGGIIPAAKLIAQAIQEQWWITISGDYDCDGATGTSVAYRGLKMLGAQNVKFIVPNRFVHGYGLSPALVDDMDERTQLIITVDSGVSNVEGVARAKMLGRRVIVTDHHLPGEVLPDADAIVNPNLKDDAFISKAMAGVGVMFYVLLATRHVIRMSDNPMRGEPDLASLLDLVALGTIADLVPLDYNNRILVAAGLRRIRQGRVSSGLRALIEKAGKNVQELTAMDFAFAVGPRLNAAGRMEDMGIGITLLTSEDPQQIVQYVDMLEEINDTRKDRQQEMIQDAEHLLATLPGRSGPTAELTDDSSRSSVGDFTTNSFARLTTAQGVVLFDPKWHSGIVGLVASKVKDAVYRPTVALAPSEFGSSEIRGSARSIPGFHLRDALALVDSRYPGLMNKFGGHAMAAGLSLDITKVNAFKQAFEEVSSELLTEDLLNAVLYTDGELPVGCFTTQFVDLLDRSGPWGQGFPAPMFQNTFSILDVSVLKEKHLRLDLEDERDGSFVKGIFFSSPILENFPTRAKITFELSVNIWKQYRNPQLMIRYLEPL
jgi:single-stranded-DNA-specific exonuclease